MNKKYLLMPIMLGFLLFNSPGLMAGPAIQEMVGILLNLHHHPSDSEKASLEKIANDSSVSANERTIASALLNMNHRVSADDKAKLEKIAKDDSAPMADRKVAGILAEVNHTPSDADKAELEKLQ
jgi:hypothetical protein